MSQAPRFVVTLLWLLATALVAHPAMAAGKLPAVDAKTLLQRERAACMRIRDDDDRANCLSEASTRFAATQPSSASETAAQLERNALRRCEPLPPPDRRDCIARMHGQGTASGSVDGGGIYRELVTIEVGTPVAVPASAAEPASAPR